MSNPSQQSATSFQTRAVIFLVGVVCIAIASMWLLSACSTSPRATSPITGQPATAGELAVQLEQWKAQQLSEAAAKEESLRRQLRQSQAEAAKRAREVQETANAAIAKATTLTELETAEISTKAAREVEAIAADAAIVASSVQSDVQLARQKLELDTRSIDAAFGLAQQSIEQQAAQRAAILGAITPIAQTAAASVPGGSAVVNLVGTLLGVAGLGVGGVGLVSSQRKQQALVKEKQEREHELRAMGRVVDSLDVLQRADESVAASIQKHKQLIDEWQGPEGKALVDALQK